MKTFIKILAATLAAASLTVGLSACNKADNEGKIIFGTNAEFPPFEFVSSEGVIGQFDGIDICIAKEIGNQIGEEAVIENMEFDSLLIALDEGKVDAVIAGMTIDPERAESVDFSLPYYTATQVMIVPENSDIKSASDMADKKIAVIQGYTGEDCVKELKYEYEAFKKGSDAILELKNGKCDVVVIDSATAENYISDNEGLKIVEDSDAFGDEQYGIAVKKGNKDLLDKINKSITDMKENGKIADFASQYID